MPTTMLTPVNRGKARQAGATLWRKQLLPVGEINYKGRKIALTREYLAGLVKAFADRAYDAVPLQFADEENRHTEKPEHRRGTVQGLELVDDGLDVIVSVGPDAAQHLTEYPDLGVSAKIVEQYERADGRFFPAAIKHVLGTLDPRITGMRPWQAIEAANEDGEVIDLTAEQYAAPHGSEAALPPAVTTVISGAGGNGGATTFTAGGGGGGGTFPATLTVTTGTAAQQASPGTPTQEETRMAFTDAQEARLARLLDLPDDQFDAVLAAGAGDDGETLSDEELQALIDDLHDEPDAEPEPAPDAEPEPATAGAALSAEAQAAIDLANSRAEETAIELARVTTALNRAAYERERDWFSREYGIPPRITDLARPVLEGEGHVVELSNGSTIDAGAIVRQVLKQIGQTVRMLDLSGELGTPLDFSADAERAAEEKAVKDRADLVAEFRRRTGV